MGVNKLIGLNLQFIIFCVLINSFSHYALGIIVDLPNGRINGTANITRISTPFYSFYALRYAQPPIGELRFESPLEERPWTDIYDATKEKTICYQVTHDTDLESEDCLFANVFTPKDLSKQNKNADLAVMVYIHGGGFVAGNGQEAAWGPKFFMDHGVVLVTFNYRLGPFGFLSTGDNIISGNMGLKDQVRLLKWVQKNIRYFGGDPKKVTIFGESSGGGSVGYLILSPLAKGLFRAAIHQSGSGLSPLAYQRNQRNITYLTASQINTKFSNNDNKNSIELLKFLKSVEAKKLDAASANATSILGGDMVNPLQLTNGFYYAPVIENKVNKEAFITKPMYELFEEGLFNRVPSIIGVNGDEALALLYVKGFLENVAKNYQSDPSYLVSGNMHIFSDNLKKFVGEDIKHFFTNNSNFEDNLVYTVNFHSSHNLEKPITKQAELQSKYVPVYFYQFNYSGKIGNNENCTLPGTTNVSHGEELNYLFSRSYNSDIPDNTDLSKFSEEDQVTHKRLITLWTNFAKFMNPTPEESTLFQKVNWSTVEPDHFKFLAIEKDLSIKKGFPKKENYNFWNQLYNRFATKPYDSY